MCLCVCLITALGKHVITSESTLWTPGKTDSSFHQSGDTWTAFPQDSSDEGGDVVEQWWPASAVEERRDRLSANQNLVQLSFSNCYKNSSVCSVRAKVAITSTSLSPQTPQDWFICVTALNFCLAWFVSVTLTSVCTSCTIDQGCSVDSGSYLCSYSVPCGSCSRKELFKFKSMHYLLHLLFLVSGRYSWPWVKCTKTFVCVLYLGYNLEKEFSFTSKSLFMQDLFFGERWGDFSVICVGH